jgi:uncharacterized protein DUF5765
MLPLHKNLFRVNIIHTMCWSKGSSFAIAVAGSLLLAAKIALNNVPLLTLLPLTLYVLMEVLQYFQYDELDKCSSTKNKKLTQFAYVLIWLQPVIWNLLPSLQRGSSPIFGFSFAVSVFILLLSLDRNIFHILHKGEPNDKEAHNIGEDCTHTGRSHLYWTFDLKTLRGLEPNWLWYFVLMFGPHIFLGDKSHFAKIMLAGAALSFALAKGNGEEFTSYWCANSIPYFLFAELANSVAI